MFVSIAPSFRFQPLAPLAVLALIALAVSPSVAAPPANDAFSAATVINVNALPFSDLVNVTEATTESGEPFACSFSFQTVWYKLTTSGAIWLRANTLASSLFGTNLNVYRDNGSGIFGLGFITCSAFGGSGLFLAQAGTTYYLQALAPCCGVVGALRVDVQEVPPPAPIANLFFFPSDPSIYDAIQFFDQSFDPGQQGFQSYTWDFGDGTTATGCCVSHSYAADGDYTIVHGATTTDGRSDTTSRPMSVRTHDVAITKFRTPQSASAGQTRQITVGVRNTRYPETVRVQLEKSVPGSFQSFQFVGSLEQAVPVRVANRTTDFNFSYTFTSDDARVGKVTFRAFASIVSGRDALAADNEALSSPVKVFGSAGVPTAESTSGAAVASGAEEVGGETPMTPAVAQLALLEVAPNPASSGVDLLVRLALPGEEAATLEVLDVAGRVMTKRVLSSLGRGIHEARVAWERRPAPGIYWVRLTQRDQSVSRRVSILQ